MMSVQQRYFLVLLCIVSMFINVVLVRADTIRLNNGRIFDGEIIDETEDEVRVEMKKGVVVFSRDEIASIGDRKISEKDIKDAEKTLAAPPAPKKTVIKKSTKSSAAIHRPEQKKEQKPVKKVKKTKDVSAVVADTVTVTSLAVSTDTVTSVSSVTVTLPVALPAEIKKEVPKGGKSVLFISLIVLATIAAILVLLIVAKRKSKS